MALGLSSLFILTTTITTGIYKVGLLLLAAWGTRDHLVAFSKDGAEVPGHSGPSDVKSQCLPHVLSQLMA